MKYVSGRICVGYLYLPMKMEPTVSSETSAIRTQTPGTYPKRNKLHLEHGEILKTRRKLSIYSDTKLVFLPLGVRKVSRLKAVEWKEHCGRH